MLTELYGQRRSRAAGEVGHVGDAFLAPLLVRLPNDWAAARHRIAYVGQETMGWGWTKADTEQYGYTWEYDRDVGTLSNFIEYDRSIEALVECYRQFDFAARQPLNYRSPFWRYFRKLKETMANDGDTASAIFTNVVRCATNSEDGFTLWSIPEADRQSYLQWQKGLLRTELAAINPTIIIFVTGPYYDPYLSAEFEELSFEPLGSFSLRAAAKLRSPALAAPAYRTYHPGYLNRSMCFAPLEAALEDAAKA